MRHRSTLGGGAAWTGATLAQADWMWQWQADELAALDTALARSESLCADWRYLDAEHFPLGAAKARIKTAATALEHGPGLVLLRGLPVARYSTDQLKRLLLGIASHIGTPVYQSVRSELISEIRDEGRAALSRGTLRVEGQEEVFLSSRARAQTPGPLRFHTDRTDVVGLLCEQQAASGGLSQIVSAVAIHDEMLRRRPDLVDELYKDLPRSRLGEEQGGEKSFYLLPVFALEQGAFTTHYSRTFVEAVANLPDAPKVSEAQWAALDLLQTLAHELAVTHRFLPGDLQFLNSHVTYHARTAFADGVDTDSQRNLLRVWLSAHQSRALPKSHAVLFGQTAPGALRGGIRSADGSLRPSAQTS